MSATAPPVKPFHFIEGRPQSAGKENAAPPTLIHHSPEKTEPTKISQPINSPSKPPPSTPATRLPLADLLGDNDENRKSRSDVNISPQEQVGWLPAQSPLSSNSRDTPASKAQKRARSSSPPSASQRSAVKRAKQKAALDLEELKQSLRTPQIDPVADLWDKYNLGVDKDTILGQQLVAIAKDPISSSPHAEDQAGNVGGLRRWTSCGMEFPSAKRRRLLAQRKVTDKQTQQGLGGLASSDAQENVDRSKTLRIGSLLAQISESLERSKRKIEEQEAPSSSSPLPDRQENFDRKSISPVRAPELSERHGSKVSSQQRRSPVHKDDRTPSPASSSNFGSDIDVSEALQDEKEVKNHNTNISTPGNCDVDAVKAMEAINEHDFDDDDFDEDDFNFTAEDFDQLSPAKRPKQMVGRSPEPTEVPVQVKRQQYEEDMDELDDDDVDEELFAAAEASATQTLSTAGRSKSSLRRRQRAIQRYLVQDVSESEYSTWSGARRFQKVLHVQEEKTCTDKTVLLRDSWADTRCSQDSYVHIVGTFDENRECVVDDAHNIIIVHPDHLISATAVADSFSCMRKAALQDRIKATSENSPPLLYGSVLHEIFQEAMKASRWDDEWLHETIDAAVEKHVEDLYQTQLSVEQAVTHLRSKMPELQRWAEVFVRSENAGLGTAKDRNDTLVKVGVDKLLDVEEHIWSPMYGMKGNIDATIQIRTEDEGGEVKVLTVPMELKTGKRESPSHRAQTALYTLLLSDRYDVEIACGILYYIETSQVIRIPAIRHELRHMIMQRNELACYVRERLALPPMLRNTHVCNKCYAKEPCFLYHKLVEGGDGETSGLRDKFDAITKHLIPSHQDFFSTWNDLLTKEEAELMKFKRELWTMLSKEREKLGRCFGNVVLIPESATEDSKSPKINRFSYSFRKKTDLSDCSFNESQIAVGDPIVVSDERGHYALAKGYVTTLTKATATVAVDRRLHNARVRQAGFDAETNQVFTGITCLDPPPANGTRSNGSSQRDLLYRIDKDEFSNGMALVRNNLVQVMSHEAFGASKIRSLVVDEIAPSFRPVGTNYKIDGPASQASINDDQRAAIEKILSAEDYALVLGMPGTGKTTTIAHIIRALVAKGKSVLLASYTHTAVDNILLKLRVDNINMLRLGALAKVHPDVKEFAQLAAEPRETIEELQHLYHDPQVVATTCLGISHAIFNERTFDYCIVDEASQITLPVCLGPIRLARAFVLVGDHYQLPPLVQNKDALQGGLDVSLFRTLCEAHPEAVTTLGVQYRMCQEIMALSNTLIYNGQLRCGSQAVANRRLRLPDSHRIDRIHAVQQSQQLDVEANTCKAPNIDTCWLSSVIGPSASPVIFLNTDPVPPHNHEIAHGARITNNLEVSLLTHLVTGLIVSGISAANIGVMTFYRSQLALIKSSIQHPPNIDSPIPPEVMSTVEAHTADRFQGRDKEVILLSCVRSNDRHHVGDLLKDWRRVNVALTRARSKLIIVGSRSTFTNGDELLAKMVRMCDVVDVPADGWDHQFKAVGISSTNTSTAANPVARSQSPKKRAPLSEKSASSINAVPNKAKYGLQKQFKVPAKVGKVLGGTKQVKTGPIIEDLLHEFLDDENEF